MNIAPGLTRICFYDLHFAATPLRSPAVLAPTVTFLGKPAEYEQRQDTLWQLNTGRLFLRSFGTRHRWSHFWKGYQSLCTIVGKAEPFPRLHLPLDAGLHNAWLSAVLPAPFGTIPVQLRLLLWPYGWSARLELTLSAATPLSDLAAISQKLREDAVFEAKSSSGSTLLGPSTLSVVFRQVTSWLQADLFTGLVGEQRKVSRHAVVALSGFAKNAEPFSYNTEVDPEHHSLPTADRARLHSILLGRPVSLAEVLDRETSGRVAITGLTAKGFAVTDLNAGSLLVLHEAAPRAGKGKTVAKCLWRNTALMMTTTNALLAVNRDLRNKPPDWMDQSADWGVEILRALPRFYESPVSRQLYAGHSELRKLTAP
jgi:hypothetical protein